MADEILQAEIDEARQAYKAYLANKIPAPIPQDLGSTVDLDGSTPETTADTSTWGKLLDLITEQSIVPPASDKAGSLIYPKSTVAGTRAAQGDATTGLKLAGAIGGPAALGIKGAAAGAPLLARILGYGEAGLSSALGAEAGHKIAQVGGLAPKTSISEDAQSILKDAAIGTAAPIVAEGVIAPLKSLAGYLNKPARIAKMQGANQTQMNLKYPISKNYKYLEENVPEFAEGVVGSGNLKKSYDAADTILKDTGQKIGDFYRNNQSLSASSDDLINHANYQTWLDKATSQATKPEDQDTIMHVIDQFNSTIGGGTQGKRLPLMSLWESSKGFGNELGTAVKNPTLAQEVYSDLRRAYVDTIQKTLETSTLAGAKPIAKLNTIYSNLHDIRDNLARSGGSTEGEILIDNSVTRGMLSPRAVTGNFLGLASNPARAGLYNLARSAQNLPQRTAPLSVATGQLDNAPDAQAQSFRPDAIPLPRTARVVEELPQGFIERGKNLIAHQAASSMGPITPESAQMGEIVSQKFVADSVRALTQGTPEDRKILAHSSAAMVPGLFAQMPGAYPSELDGKILTSIDGEAHLGSTLQGLYSGLIPSGTAYDQITVLNTNKIAPVLFRPGQPIQAPQQTSRPDVNSLVESFQTSQGEAKQPSY